MANLMIGSLYKALRHAGVPDDEASLAASDVAAYENRINKIEVDLTVLKWMVGANLALGIAILARLFLQ